MTAATVGFMDKKDSTPSRGSRVAAYVETHMRRRGLGIGELAFAAGVDKRDLRRLLTEQSCGWRLEDALAAFFGWDFTHAVMTPVHGADHLTALEVEIERERNEIAARENRLARLRSARRARSAVAGGELRLVAEEGRSWTAPHGRRAGDLGREPEND